MTLADEELALKWRQTIVPVSANIQAAIQNLNDVGVKIVLVVNDKGELAGTVSDGDIRRGLLRGLALPSPITGVLKRDPLVVPEGVSRELVLQLMNVNRIQQIPVIDPCGRPTGLHLWDELTSPVTRVNTMVIMAGGTGTRLRPHTESCPKPMLLVGGRPMLEHIIERAKLDGFSCFILAINYLGHVIERHFGDGSKYGVQISYLREESPLGTAGALSLLDPRPEDTLVVTNGDVIADIRFSELLDFHVRQNASATMAVREFEWQHPFGVVHINGIEIVGFEEKPISRSHINAGVYALDPATLECLARGERCDMPTLFERLQADGMRTLAYAVHEPWLDVGRPADLALANKLEY